MTFLHHLRDNKALEATTGNLLGGVTTPNRRTLPLLKGLTIGWVGTGCVQQSTLLNFTVRCGDEVNVSLRVVKNNSLITIWDEKRLLDEDVIYC